MLREMLDMSPADLQREISRLNNDISQGDESLVDIGKKLYFLKKYLENFFKSIQGEIHDEYDSLYSRPELIEMNVTLRQTTRFNVKSIDDDEYAMLKEAADVRLNKIKEATKLYLRDGSRVIDPDTGEEIPVGSMGATSKSISFK